MKIFLILAWLLVLTGVAYSQKQCTKISATSQNCLATISWTASVVDATHDAPTNYVIRRSDGGGAMTQIGSVAATSTSFQNTFTDAGNVAHCWTVVATAGTQSSPPSTQACWTTPAISGAAPATPQGVSVSMLNSSVLRVTWMDTENETGYEIHGREAKGQKTFERLVALGPDTTVWDWEELRRFTSYCVEIMALGNPNSPFSAPACGTTSK